ncbi:uncharacterized protein LOC100878586 [Megachile rotundata]|uniref:uncharacterized protein LOC100878586 n=1 Tax=Megachile rotundata TaxID=143995 RepID=UPI003FD17DCA
MYDITKRNTSERFCIAIAIILALFCLPELASARPTLERLRHENAITHDAVLNFAKLEKGNVAEELNEELLGTVKQRYKRLSDQRRAELETLMALSKMTEKLNNVIRGGRHLDSAKSGRTERSIFDLNAKNLQKLFQLSGKFGYKGNKAYPVVG